MPVRGHRQVHPSGGITTTDEAIRRIMTDRPTFTDEEVDAIKALSEREKSKGFYGICHTLVQDYQSHPHMELTRGQFDMLTAIQGKAQEVLTNAGA